MPEQIIIRLNNVRLSFPNLFEPQDFNGDGNLRYGASFILDPGSKNEDKIRAAIEKAASEQWKKRAASEISALEKKDRLCIHDGNDKDYEGFEDKLFVSANNKARPRVIDSRKDDNGDWIELTERDGRPYAGCYVNASMSIYAQDNKWGKRINASLRGVQWVRDGEAFSGGGVAKDDEFEEVDDEEFDDLIG